MLSIWPVILSIFLFVSVVIPVPAQAANLRVPILMYHYIAGNPNPSDRQRDILSISPEKFEAQMQYLSQNGYTPITLDTLYGIFNGQATVAGKPVVLTFDDGYIDFYTNAFPILRRFNFHAVSFIPTGLIGGGYYMNWNQIKEIAATGLVTFEGHTVSHRNLPSASYAVVFKELQDSKNILQANTGYPVNFVAYPNGTSNKTVQAAAQKAGYVGGLGTWSGKAGAQSLNLPRIRISGFWSLKEFASRL